jgi:hypothetical protein
MVSFFLQTVSTAFFVFALLIWTAGAFVFKQPAMTRWTLWAVGCAGIAAVAQAILFLYR